MCEPTTIIMGVTAVLGAYSQVQQGKAAEAMGDYQQEQAQADAAAERGAAQVEAELIRKKARATVGAATAQMAASGLDVTADGTATEINKTIYQSAEYDAQMGIFGANDKANHINAQGEADKIAGQVKKDAGYIGAVTTLGSAASQMDWKSMAGAGSGAASGVGSSGAGYTRNLSSTQLEFPSY